MTLWNKTKKFFKSTYNHVVTRPAERIQNYRGKIFSTQNPFWEVLGTAVAATLITAAIVFLPPVGIGGAIALAACSPLIGGTVYAGLGEAGRALGSPAYSDKSLEDSAAEYVSNKADDLQVWAGLKKPHRQAQYEEVGHVHDQAKGMLSRVFSSFSSHKKRSTETLAEKPQSKKRNTKVKKLKAKYTGARYSNA